MFGGRSVIGCSDDVCGKPLAYKDFDSVIAGGSSACPPTPAVRPVRSVDTSRAPGLNRCWWRADHRCMYVAKPSAR